jgi:hypothetical protein
MTTPAQPLEKLSFAVHAAVISPQMTLRLHAGNNSAMITLGGAPWVECRK